MKHRFVYLARIVALLAAGAKAARWQNENLFRYSINFPNAFRVAHYRNLRLTYS